MRETAGIAHTDRIPSNSLWSIIHNQIKNFFRSFLSSREGIFQLSAFSQPSAVPWTWKRSAKKFFFLRLFVCCEWNWNLLPSQTFHRLFTPVTRDWRILSPLSLLDLFVPSNIINGEEGSDRVMEFCSVRIIKTRSQFMYFGMAGAHLSRMSWHIFGISTIFLA